MKKLLLLTIILSLTLAINASVYYEVGSGETYIEAEKFSAKTGDWTEVLELANASGGMYMMTNQTTGSEDASLEKELAPKLTNIPNPFNPTTTILCNIPQINANTKLQVFSLDGKLIQDIPVSGKTGNYAVKWTSRDLTGNSVASGIYFAVLQSGSYKITKKMVLVR